MGCDLVGASSGGTAGDVGGGVGGVLAAPFTGGASLAGTAVAGGQLAGKIAGSGPSSQPTPLFGGSQGATNYAVGNYNAQAAAAAGRKAPVANYGPADMVAGGAVGQAGAQGDQTVINTGRALSSVVGNPGTQVGAAQGAFDAGLGRYQ